MFDSWKFKKRLDSMENTLRTLQDGFQQLELEWINAYAKFKKIAGRIAKDQAVIDSRHPGEGESGADNPALSATPSAGLTDRQKQIQQTILRRRGGTIQ